MKVNSSAFTDIDYDPEAQHLTVKFTSGHTHRYENVPPETHEQLMASPSIGAAFHRLIRQNKNFTSTKL